MKFHLSSWLIAAASLTSLHPTSVDAVGGGLRSSPDRLLQNGHAYGKWKKCVVLHKHVQMESNESLEEVDCYDQETKMYNRLSAELEDKVKKDFKNGKAKSGATMLNADGTYETNGDGRRVLHVSDADSITYEDFVPEHGRRLSSVGAKEMLAIRVVAADDSTTASEVEISDSWFGTNGDPVNLKSQYAACSYGALQCNAASKTTSTGVAVSNGVFEVSISNTVSGVDNSVIRDAVVDAGTAALGSLSGQFDHVMLCLPPGTNGSWIGYAYVNWYLSVYNDNWCKYVSIQMHEIGHNLGLGHSGETATYDDQTGMMGYSYSQSDGPVMCFNAPKNQQLGWYPEGELVIDEFFEGKILGISNYDDLVPSNGEIIMAKINDSVSDWYVSFNRATGINSGTKEGANQVLVHKRPQGTGYAASELIAKLSLGGSYNGITVDGVVMPVSVSSINTSSAVGYAQVKIGNAPATNSPTPNPTPPPTNAPVTSSPTKSPTTAAPTAPPTPEPTALPTTAAPTATPTPEPTAQPTNPPTSEPTASPTTASPTPLPTPGPTASPTTAAPTATPTPEPTAQPTNPPTSEPTASPTTASPTPLPTPGPTASPTTAAPTATPTPEPTAQPTNPPTSEPTASPTTASPTPPPTPEPTALPTTAAPTATPTPEPTAQPTNPPTSEPTASPTTAAPTPLPTPGPTAIPTNQPTSAPTVPIDCSQYYDGRSCPAGTCRWVGKNWKTGECVDADGNGPTPIPTKPPTSAPSPTPPPNPPTGCDVCYGEICCGTCKTWGKPSKRGCLV